MDIRTAAHYMQLGYRIRRSSWDPAWCTSLKLMRFHKYDFKIDDLLADDWEVITTFIVKDFPLTYADDWN